MSSAFSGEAEQRQFGKNGADIIDEFCEASIFEEAAKYLTSTKLKLSNDQKLAFYSLFKQATVGPCNTPKPSLLSMYDRTKWNAWNDLGKMSKDAAIVRYVNELEKVAPSWKEHAGVLVDNDGDDDDSSSGGAGGDGAMITPQSRPVVEAEIPISDLTAAQKTIQFWAGQDRADKVREAIKEGASVDDKDEEGRTALHWAVDRAHESLARVLLTELKANANATDNEGSTPLHYAALCEHVPLIVLLLKHGADASIEDSAGETAAQAIRAIQGVPADTLALLAKAKSN